jgi:hypothetical protein
VLQTQASSWRGDFAVIEAIAPFLAVAAVATVVRDDAADIEGPLLRSRVNPTAA